MSIINEALKKAQQENKNTVEKKADVASPYIPESEFTKKTAEAPAKIVVSPTRRKRKFIFLILIAGLAVAGSMIFLSLKRVPEVQLLPSRISSPPAIRLQKPTEFLNKTNLPTLVLNGIVYDEEKSYAIVNNTVLMKGEVIEGATLIDIRHDSVKFEVEGKEIELRAK